jgi:hypothetical protein
LAEAEISFEQLVMRKTTEGNYKKIQLEVVSGKLGSGKIPQRIEEEDSEEVPSQLPPELRNLLAEISEESNQVIKNTIQAKISKKGSFQKQLRILLD